MRLLIVYGYQPSGHASAAEALGASARSRGFDVRLINISDYHYILGPMIAQAYLQLIRRFPKIWNILYDNQTIAPIAQGWRRLYLGLQGGKLKAKLKEWNPDVIVCTHAPPLAALALEKKKGGFTWPLVGVITDYRVHTYWIASKADLYLTATPQSSALLAGKGIPGDCIRQTGIPIHPTYEQPVERLAARKRLGLPPDIPVVLLSGGSRGLGQILKIAHALLMRLPRVRVIASCGNNHHLQKLLKARFGLDQRLWVYSGLSAEQVKELMCASDLLIGKAGGLTIAESMAIGLPVVFFEPIPGQEDRNAEYILGAGGGARAENLPDLVNLAERLLGAPSALEMMRLAAVRLGQPRAAHEGLEAILALLPASV